MKKPNPETFARTVLWHLCALRAEVSEVQIQVATILAERSGRTLDEVAAELNESTKAQTENLYRDAIREAGLD